MLISILLRPFTMLFNALRYQERFHFVVNFIEFPVKFFDPLDSFHGQPDELFDFCLFSLPGNQNLPRIVRRRSSHG